MPMRALVPLLLGIAACGPGKSKFVPEYADGYCAYLFECVDPAQLTFDGILSVDDCLAEVGPAVDDLMQACKYHKGKAHDCLKELELVPCPAEGEPIESGLPAVCSEVWTECPNPPADGGDENPSTTEDTDA
jgi:hypothetical protein